VLPLLLTGLRAGCHTSLPLHASVAPNRSAVALRWVWFWRDRAASLSRCLPVLDQLVQIDTVEQELPEILTSDGDGDPFQRACASRSRIVQGERPSMRPPPPSAAGEGAPGQWIARPRRRCAVVPFTPTFASSMPALCPDFGSVRGRPGLWRAPRRRASPRPLPILGVLTRAPGGRCLRTRRERLVANATGERSSGRTPAGSNRAVIVRCFPKGEPAHWEASRVRRSPSRCCPGTTRREQFLAPRRLGRRLPLGSRRVRGPKMNRLPTRRQDPEGHQMV